MIDDCYSPLDGMLVHHRVTPQQYVASTPLYTWVKTDKVGLSSLSKERMRQARLEPVSYTHLTLPTSDLV